jgi:hypothetical protein
MNACASIVAGILRLTTLAVWLALWAAPAPCLAVLIAQQVPSFQDLAPAVRIEILRNQMSELRQTVILKRAEWDKLHGEYQRMVANSGGRMNRVGQAKVAKLDAEARQVMAEIELAEGRLEELQELMEEAVDDQRRAERSASAPERELSEDGVEEPLGLPARSFDAEDRPAPRQPRDGGAFGGVAGRRTSEGSRPDPPAPSRGYPFLDLADPVGVGGAGMAVYAVELLAERFGDEVVRDTRRFSVQYDALGVPTVIARVNPGNVFANEYRIEVGEGGLLALYGTGMHSEAVLRAFPGVEQDDGTTNLDLVQYESDGRENQRFRWILQTREGSGRVLKASSQDRVDWLRTRGLLQHPLLAMGDDYNVRLPTIGIDSVQFDYYPSGRLGRVIARGGSGAYGELLSVEYSYSDGGGLAQVDYRAKTLDAVPSVRLVYGGWDQSGRWTVADLYTPKSQDGSRNLLVRTARIRREIDSSPSLARFVRREFNCLPPRIGNVSSSAAEGPELLGSVPLASVSSDVDSTPRAGGGSWRDANGSTAPSGASAAGVAPRETSSPRVLEFEEPPSSRPASALEREGEALLAIVLLGAFLVLAGGVVWLLIAGASDSIVIFENWTDFALSFFAAAAVIGGTIGAAVSWQETGTWSGLLLSIVVILVGCALGAKSFALAFKHNGRGALGVVVGTFKIFAGLLLVVGVFGHGSKVLDRKSTNGERIHAMIMLALFAWIAHALVNGERVLAKRAAGAAP